MNAGHLCHQDHADILKATFNRITGLRNFLVVAADVVVVVVAANVVVVAVDVECSFETQVVFRNSEKNDFGPTCPFFLDSSKIYRVVIVARWRQRRPKQKKGKTKIFFIEFFSLNTRKLGNEK